MGASHHKTYEKLWDSFLFASISGKILFPIKSNNWVPDRLSWSLSGIL